LKIAYVTAGAAGMYCGSCLHDNTLARALIALEHDVALIPTYTPIRTDEEDVSLSRVFYGAINVYLEQKSALFRHTPWLVDRLLAAPGLLEWAARGGGSTDARTLGALTLSVLRGEEGHQRKELERLVHWLAEEWRPDVVHLTNSMFLGMAGPIRRELGVPVLCSVQGEDLFLDGLVEPYRSEVRGLLSERAADVDGFVATSDFYAGYMAELLGVAAERMHCVRLGVSLDGFDGRPERDAGEPFVIGYLARLCPEKGLHLLAEAFRRLAESVGRERVRLVVAGYLGPRDREYAESVRAELSARGLERSVDWRGEVDRAGKAALLRGIHVLSVPTIYREPKGLFVLEALANGTPVVQPRHGSFPELIEATGGGLLVAPGDPAVLAATFAGTVVRWCGGTTMTA
jgi:glycosyltransferase involved in cell wall biosynthesis